MPDEPFDAIWETPEGRYIPAHLIAGPATCRNCHHYRGKGRVTVASDKGKESVTTQVRRWFNKTTGIPGDIWHNLRTCFFHVLKEKS